MASCSGTQGYWKVELIVNETNTSIANNTSTASWELWLKRTSGTSYIGGTPTIKIYVSGTLVNDTSDYIYITGITTSGVKIKSGTLSNIQHNDDGTIRNNSMSFTWTGSGFSPNSVSGSGTYSTATIARKTICPSMTAIIKSPTSLVLQPKASNTFKHSLKVTFGGSNYYVNANGGLQSSEYKFPTSITSIPITLPSSLYSKFTGISQSGSLLLTTYKDNTSIGTSGATIVVKVNEDLCRPSITSYTMQDQNVKTLAITQNANDTIQYSSRVQTTFNSYYISDPEDTNTTIVQKLLNGVDITSQQSLIIADEATNTFTITLKNSRGITGYSQISSSGDLLPYIPLTFNIQELKRSEPTTGEIELSYNGNFYAQTFKEGTDEHFHVGDEMNYNNTKLQIPNNIYMSLSNTSHETDILIGSSFRLVERVTIYPSGSDTITDYELVVTDLVGQSTGTDWILYLAETTTSGGSSSTSVLQNPTDLIIPSLSLGTIQSEDDSSEFYQYIINLDGSEPPIVNTLTITWKYREKGSSTWTTGGTLSPTINSTNNTYSGNISLGNIFDYQKQYEFLFIAEDLLRNSQGDGTVTNPINPIEVEQSVTRGLPVIWWSEDSVHVLGDVYVTGTIYNNPSL